jgi:hypothetical protein
VRWLVLAAVAALSSLSVIAAEPVAEEAPAAVEALATDVAVIVTPIPMPAQVTELLGARANPAKALADKKVKVADRKPLPKILLSRTERQRIALAKAVAPAKAGDPPLRKILRDEEGDGGYEDLPLHRSFSRPRVAPADADDDADAVAALSDGVKLRLLLARMKAVEAHALAWAVDQPGVADEPLSEAVQTRLSLARMKAVAAHRSRFS